MSQALAVTAATWDKEFLQSDVPVLVNFWAEWSGPCRRFAPELDAVAEQMTGKAKILKVNIDEEPDLVSRYSVLTTPASFIFKGGKVVDKILGAHPRQVIAAKLGEHV